MNVAGFSNLLFLVGRRYPAFPLALLRRLPLGLLQAMRGPGFRDVLRAALRSDYYREAFARTVSDPEFIDRSRRLADDLTPMTYRDVEQWMKNMSRASPEALEFIAAMLRNQGGKID